MDLQPLGPDFFLVTNTDEYYVWYKPMARRSSLILNSEGVVHQEHPIVLPDGTVDPGQRKVLIPELSTPDICGITITGYLFTPTQHAVRGGRTLFVVDTLYNMRDPYTEEDMQLEYGRVTNLRDFFASFRAVYGGIELIAQDLMSVTLNGTVWGDRIDDIWNRRIRFDYPIDGLVFYSRDRDYIRVWTDYRTVVCQNGDRVGIPDINLGKPAQEVDRYTMTAEDLQGVGFTTILWLLDSLGLPLNILQVPDVLPTLDQKTKDYVNSVLLLSPRQRALFGSLG